MIIKLSLLILWMSTALLEGTRDGFFYYARNTSANPDNKNIHWIFALERLVIISLIGWIHILSYSILNTGVFVISLILIFSWFHNGIYYKTRNYLDKNVYPKGWFDSSTTSESMLEFSVAGRMFMAITGFIGIIASFTFK